MISGQMRRHGVAAILGLAAMATALAPASGPAEAADAAGFSVQGTMTLPTPQQDWHFTIAGTSAMDFRTWANGGGTNFLGETILPGGIDSILWLYDSGMNQIATNDDSGGGLDSHISGSFAGGNYTLRMTAYGSPGGLGDGHWAADLANWSGNLTVTDLPQISSTVTTLSMGSLGTATATLALAPGANLTVANNLNVNAGGLVTAANGTLNADGNIQVAGGVINQTLNTGLLWAANKTMEISGGGRVTYNGGFNKSLPTNAIVNIHDAGSRMEVIDSGLSISNGSQVNVTDGGSVSGDWFITVGWGNTGTLTVSGGTAASHGGDNYWGCFGGEGVVTFKDAATGTFDGTVYLGMSNTAGTKGTLNVLSGAKVQMDKLYVNSDGATSPCEALVSGAGSELHATSTLTIGAASGGPAKLTVNNVADTYGGTTTVKKTGTMDLQNLGWFHVQGPLTVDGGSITIGNYGNLAMEGAYPVTVQGGGTLDFARNFTWSVAQTLTVTGSSSQLKVHVPTNDAIFAVHGGLVNISAGGTLQTDLISVSRLTGSATVTVDAGTLTASGTPAGASANDIGGDGTGGTLTFKNNSTATFAKTLNVAPTGSGTGTYGALNVQSGSQVGMADLLVGTGLGASASAAVTVTGTDSKITQSGASALTVGGADGAATLDINSSGEFDTSAGLMKVNKTGSVTVASHGYLRANGNITVAGGQLRITDTGTMTWADNKTMNVTGGGRVTLGTGTQIDTGATVNVGGSGSKLEYVPSDSSGFAFRGGTHINVTDQGTLSTTNGFFIGYTGAATVLVDGEGSNITDTGLGYSTSLGFDGGAGALTLRNGAAGSLAYIRVGGDSTDGSQGTVRVESGARLTSPCIEVGGRCGSVANSLTVANSGSGVVQPGGMVQLFIGSDSGLSTGTVTVTDHGSFEQSPTLPSYISARIGTGQTLIDKTGTLNIDSGSVSLGDLYVLPGGTVNFYSGSLGFQGDLTVGPGGLLGPYLDLGSNRNLALSGKTTVEAGSTLSLYGGALSTGSLEVHGSFMWESGTLAITGPDGLAIGSAPFGPSCTLGQGQTLIVQNLTTVPGGAIATVDRGQMFPRGGLTNAGTVIFNSGTLDTVSGTFTNQTPGRLFIGSAASMEDNGPIVNNGRIELQGGAARLGGTGAITNNALITGDGEVAKPVTNTASGEIRVTMGRHLLFSGACGANSGLIALQDGIAEFSQALTNSTAGAIMGRGTLIASGGLTNNGSIAFSGGYTDVYGDIINAAGAKIVISGGGTTTFYDDVNATGGEMRVGPGCAVVFFGSYNGGATGTGTVYIEGDMRPGHSPAEVTFEGDLALGNGAHLVAELAGTTPAGQYDVIDVGGSLALGGTLDVDLLYGFQPQAGQTFDILNFDPANLSGEFDAINLPDLGGGLSWDTSSLYTTGALGVVPEPATMALVGLGMLAVIRRKFAR